VKQPNMATSYGALAAGHTTRDRYGEANAAYGNPFLTDAGQPRPSFRPGGRVPYERGGQHGPDQLARTVPARAFSDVSGPWAFLSIRIHPEHLFEPPERTGGPLSALQTEHADVNMTNAAGVPRTDTPWPQQTKVSPVAWYLAQRRPCFRTSHRGGPHERTPGCSGWDWLGHRRAGRWDVELVTVAKSPLIVRVLPPKSVAISKELAGKLIRDPQMPLHPVVRPQQPGIDEDQDRVRPVARSGPILGRADRRVLFDTEVVQRQGPSRHALGTEHRFRVTMV
jgi:hypothetical protein